MKYYDHLSQSVLDTDSAELERQLDILIEHHQKSKAEKTTRGTNHNIIPIIIDEDDEYVNGNFENISDRNPYAEYYENQPNDTVYTKRKRISDGTDMPPLEPLGTDSSKKGKGLQFRIPRLSLSQLQTEVADILEYLKVKHFGADDNGYTNMLSNRKYKFTAPSINRLMIQEVVFEQTEKLIDSGDFNAWPFSTRNCMVLWWNDIMSCSKADHIMSMLTAMDRATGNVIREARYDLENCFEQSISYIQYVECKNRASVPTLIRLCEIYISKAIVHEEVDRKTRCEVLAFSCENDLVISSTVSFVSLVVDMIKIMSQNNKFDFSKAFEGVSYKFALMIVNSALSLCTELKAFNKFIEVLTYGSALYANQNSKLPPFFLQNLRLLIACTSQAILKTNRFFDKLVGCSIKLLATVVYKEEVLEITGKNDDGHFVDNVTFHLIIQQARDEAEGLAKRPPPPKPQKSAEDELWEDFMMYSDAEEMLEGDDANNTDVDGENEVDENDEMQSNGDF